MLAGASQQLERTPPPSLPPPPSPSPPLPPQQAHKKAIRRATVNTFGYIAKAIGPQDVLVTLLNNLKVQERQNRVCTTVAIAIVAETCAPFTVLPALMNEYRVSARCSSRSPTRSHASRARPTHPPIHTPTLQTRHTRPRCRS